MQAGSGLIAIANAADVQKSVLKRALVLRRTQEVLMADVWNSSISRVGSVDPDGSVWDSSIRKVGSVDSARRVFQGGAALLLLL